MISLTAPNRSRAACSASEMTLKRCRPAVGSAPSRPLLRRPDSASYSAGRVAAGSTASNARGAFVNPTRQRCTLGDHVTEQPVHLGPKLSGIVVVRPVHLPA